jgi:tetratricopeptide (TPR) repeat protein
VFRNADASSHIDFADFHGAILALVIAQRYEEAAMYFSLSLASSLRVGSFSLFEILFMVLNGDLVHANLKDPFARFLLLLSEIQMRLQNEATPSYSRIVKLLKQIRVLPKAEITANGFVHIRMTLYGMISAVHVRRLKDKTSFSHREGRRAFAPLQRALRIAVDQKDADFIAFVLGQYGNLYSLEKEPDLELLKQAVLTSAATSREISGDAITGIYTQFVISKKYDDSSLELSNRHSREYHAAGRANPFFACQHAIATIIHDRFSRYNEARELISLACAQAVELGASPDVASRTDLLMADSYWAEKDYVNSAKHYKRALSASFDEEMLNQWVRERLADSLIFMGRIHEATLHLVKVIRRQHATLLPDHKAHLYARLAYAYGLDGQLRKAAIACSSLCRIARALRSVDIDILSVTICDWLLQYFQYSDPVIPQSTAQIRDSSVLSDKPTVDQANAWSARGPLFARALVLLGVIFELLQDIVRAEYFYRAARTVFQTDGQAIPGSGEGLFFALRICRIQIKRKMFSQASVSFAGAVEDFLIAKRNETAEANPGASAFAVFTFLEPILTSLSDSELIQCFAAIENQAEPHIRAWLLLRECNLLFDRLFVQKGKSKLLDAEALATTHARHDLLLLVLHEKLFVRFQEMYSNQADWLQDVLETGMLLARDDTRAPSCGSFGRNISIIATKSRTGPMHAIGIKISEYGQRWHQNPFLFSFLAAWTIGRQYRLKIHTLAEVETYLRNVGSPFKNTDFA